MKVTVFGATGRTGKEIVSECLKRGYEVVAFCRKPGLHQQNRLSIVYGNALNPKDADKAIEGADSVICALGVKPNEKRDVLSAATANILSAMLRKKVRRFICMSSYGVGNSRNDLPFLLRTVISVYLGNVFKDKLRQEELIEASNIDWVIVRPSILTDGPAKGVFQAGEKIKWKGLAKISRKDVAKFIVDQLTDNVWVRKKVGISY